MFYKGGERKREKKGGRERSESADSLPDPSYSQGWARRKQETRNSVSPTWVAGTQIL